MGLQRERQRKRKARSGIRVREREARYRDFSYMIELIPTYHIARDKAQHERHDRMIEAVRHSGQRYRVVSHIRHFRKRTRIYFADDSGLVFAKIIDADLVWKMFRLEDPTK